MGKRKRWLLLSITVLFMAIFSACGNSSTSGDHRSDTDEASSVDVSKNETVDTSSDEQTETNSVSNQSSPEENVETETTTDVGDTKEESEDIMLSSGEEAIQYLREELDMEENEDIIFDDMAGTLETDDGGSYYKITLYSKELQESGGSGTLERYKVYVNGIYELDY